MRVLKLRVSVNHGIFLENAEVGRMRREVAEEGRGGVWATKNDFLVPLQVPNIFYVLVELKIMRSKAYLHSACTVFYLFCEEFHDKVPRWPMLVFLSRNREAVFSKFLWVDF